MATPADQPTKLLIVDDEKSICDILTKYLEKNAYEVFAARDGRQAVDILTENNIDLVLTDIKMPGMSGVDLLKWVKERNKALPVLITTGYPTLDTAIEALKLGAFDYLTKPFHLEEIGEKIKRALESKRLEEENLVFSKLVSLHEVTKVLASTHQLRELNHLFLDYSSRMSHADGGALLFTDSSSKLRIVESSSAPFDVKFWQRGFFRDGARWVVEKEDPLVAEENAALPSGVESTLPPELKSCIFFPLKTPKRILGVLTLVRNREREAFSNVDLEIVNVLASQASISIENVRLYQSIRDNYLKTILAFALAVEAKDRYTHGHSENVMKYTVALAKQLGMSDSEVEHVKYAGLLHDIGKIGVSEAILNKPSRLTDGEFREIKKHPELGARIIADVPFLKTLVPEVQHHHEFYDGRGYPEGLSGEDIPFGARILGVADAFEAMTSDRPYRKSLSLETAVGILKEQKSKQFDPRVVDAFLAVIEAGLIKR
jgi:putative nucleotidyltransferase with HDIG domain